MKTAKLTVRIFFILTVWSSTSGLQVSFPQAQYEVARGDDITLTCSFQPANPLDSKQLVIITWSAEADNPADPKVTVATFYSANNVLDLSPSYEGRATVTVDLAKRESALTLQRVTLQDNREYQCRVQIPRDDEGKLADITSVLVLVAPSVPIVKMQGTAEYWNNISLTCVSVEGSPPPVYTWKSYDVKNIARQLPPKTTEKNGVLSLFNISMDTSGFYICTSTNKIREASYNFTLTVLPPTMNIGSTAGIIGGVLAGILVLGLGFYCFCKRKNKHKGNVEGAPETVEFLDQPKVAAAQYQDTPPDEVKPNSEHVGRHEERGERDMVLNLLANNPNIKAIDDDDEEDDGHRSNVGRQEFKDDNRRDLYGGSRDRLDDRKGGSQDRLDQSDRYSETRGYSGSRDRLDDNRRYGSRDHLDNGGRYGSRDRLDDQGDRYSESRGHSGSRDNLDNGRRYGSRDRLDDQGDRYSESRGRTGSRDHLDNGRRYGSRDRLDDQGDRYSESRGYSGSRDRLDDAGRRYGGSRDRLDM